MAAEERVCGVVVLYKPCLETVRNVETLLEQVAHVVVVDNGSDGAIISALAEIKGCERLTVLRNGENRGVAAALNQGVNWSTEAGYGWMATFDQDSLVTDGMIAAMLSAYSQSDRCGHIGIVCPCYREPNSSRIVCGGERATDRLTGITSGAMVKREVFEQVGGFDEDLFVDYVDNEFCLHCASKGYEILRAPNAILVHRLGSPTEHRLLGRRFITTNHSALRRYYAARNRVRVYRRYGRRFPVWVLRDARRFMRELVLVLCFESGKWRKFRAVAFGLYDGMRGRYGKAARAWLE